MVAAGVEVTSLDAPSVVAGVVLTLAAAEADTQAVSALHLLLSPAVCAEQEAVADASVRVISVFSCASMSGLLFSSASMSEFTLACPVSRDVLAEDTASSSVLLCATPPSSTVCATPPSVTLDGVMASTSPLRGGVVVPGIVL